MAIERGASGNGRPSPEALLAAAAREDRGKLKIFLGAAPGVGKTYEMLLEARRKRAESVDVVVGVVETHGRRETEALLRGLPVVPRQQIAYKGRVLSELDLDAVLERAPALVLVDELAHTNAPGCRHAKRYLDVEELLAAGIDVDTTLNIQHLESLNDVVAQITRIRVRETVPDSILDRADAIEVVDITPEELIRRLQEGKVYVPEQAKRALNHYFSTGNLTALREMALRRTAERVDEQMIDYMRAHAIAGPWPSGARLLACIDAGPQAADVVRHAKRLADRLRAPWTALYIATAGHEDLDDAARDRIGSTLRLAMRLGGEALSLPGEVALDAVLAYARQNNVTQIVVGRPRGAWWNRLRERPFVTGLLEHANGIAVQVITSEGTPPPPSAVKTERPPRSVNLVPYAMTSAFVAGAAVLADAISRFVNVPNISLVFIAAVLFSAVRYGLGPSIFASLLSVLAYNFFLVEPKYTLLVADPANVLALIIFLLVAVLTTGLMARTRAHSLAARNRGKTTAELYAFSRKLAGIGQLDDLLWATVHQVASMLRVEVVLLIAERGQLEVRAGFPPEDRLEEAEFAAARWCWDHNQPAGWGADTLPGVPRLFVPLRTGRGTVGVIGIMREPGAPLLAPDERRLLDALVDQAAIGIERTLLAEGADEARIEAETERLREALLSSVSQDLCTPIAVIRDSLATLNGGSGDAERALRLDVARSEAERLDRHVTNLLHLTRLDGGALRVERGDVELGDLIAGALLRTGHALADHRVAVNLAPDLPPLHVDLALIEVVLVNVLDHIAASAPPGSVVELAGRGEAGRIVIEIRDEGDAIPPDELDKVFDRFHPLSRGAAEAAGSGLGLAVCRGLIEAHGGTITAANRRDRTGAVFTIVLPAVRAGPRGVGGDTVAAGSLQQGHGVEAGDQQDHEGGGHPGQIAVDEVADRRAEHLQ